jgi:hypothetical protein
MTFKNILHILDPQRPKTPIFESHTLLSVKKGLLFESTKKVLWNFFCCCIFEIILDMWENLFHRSGIDTLTICFSKLLCKTNNKISTLGERVGRQAKKNIFQLTTVLDRSIE